MLTDHNVPKFDPQIYSQFALNYLLIYAVYFLAQMDNEVTFEDMVAACFLMFPEQFKLRSYPNWPDSLTVNRRWVDCRSKGLIIGSTARGFSLTPKGLEVAERVGETLEGKRPLIRPPGTRKVRAEIRTRAGRFVRALEESDAYKLFERIGEQAGISEFDFRSMLLCTMESSASTLRNNLEQFRQHASFYEREDLLNLLGFCEKKFAHLLTGISKQSERYRGGMLRQKVK